MKRVSLIDLGSNSVRFVISEITESGSYRLIYQQKESIRLSEGMWTHQMLTKPAMERAIKTLKALSHMAKAMGVTEIQGIATAAVRLASNGNSFIRRVYAETGIPLRPISGEEEAYLGFLGVVNTIGLDDFIVFDLGGASIEISLIENRQLKKSVSLPMGALVMTGQFKSGHEFTSAEYEAMVRYIQEVLHRESWLKHTKLPLIGIGGTARNIAKMDQREKNYPIPKLHNYKEKSGYGGFVSSGERNTVGGTEKDFWVICGTGRYHCSRYGHYYGIDGVYKGIIHDCQRLWLAGRAIFSVLWVQLFSREVWATMSSKKWRCR